MTDSQQALYEIKQMKADRYFLNGVQGDFVAAIGVHDVWCGKRSCVGVS